MTSSTNRRNLFDTIDHWISHPTASFNLWLGEQPYKTSSTVVYQAMFARFCQWLESNGKTIDRCESGDIPLFLDHPNANLPATRQRAQSHRQRQQYIRLLERVFAHLSTLGLSSSNPAKMAAIQGAGQGKDKPTRFLNEAERQRVIQYLENQLGELRNDSGNVDAWMEYRDLALVAIIMGAGLKVGNIQHLTLNCINMAEQYIELSQPRYTHRARILPFAVPPINAWLTKLQQLTDQTPCDAPLVFIGNHSKGYGRQAKSLQIHPSSIHRRIQKILGACDISGERTSAQTLRNTYTAILIDAGASDHELVDFLGLHASISAQRLRINYASFKSSQLSQVDVIENPGLS